MGKRRQGHLVCVCALCGVRGVYEQLDEYE